MARLYYNHDQPRVIHDGIVLDAADVHCRMDVWPFSTTTRACLRLPFLCLLLPTFPYGTNQKQFVSPEEAAKETTDPVYAFRGLADWCKANPGMTRCFVSTDDVLLVRTETSFTKEVVAYSQTRLVFGHAPLSDIRMLATPGLGNMNPTVYSVEHANASSFRLSKSHSLFSTAFGASQADVAFYERVASLG